MTFIPDNPKDPNAVIDYAVDWTLWLDGDTISSSIWTAATGITIDSNTNTITNSTVWLSGGTAGASYEVTNRVVTAGGRTDDRTILISVAER